MRFSPSTGCFYPEDLNYADLPEDIMEVTDAEFKACMAREPDEVIKVLRGKLRVVKATKNK